MISIREAGRRLEWVHPDVERPEYELRMGSELIATFVETSADSAIARTAEDILIFRKFGYANPHVIVKREGSDKEEARFDSSETEPGLLKFASGRLFHWECHLWRASWLWNDSSGRHLMALKRDFGVAGKNEGHVEIADLGTESEGVGLLVLIGWYLILLSAETSGNAG